MIFWNTVKWIPLWVPVPFSAPHDSQIGPIASRRGVQMGDILGIASQRGALLLWCQNSGGEKGSCVSLWKLWNPFTVWCSVNSASFPWWEFWSPFKEALPEREQVWLAVHHCSAGLRKSLFWPLPTSCPKTACERLKLCQLWQCPKEKSVRGKKMRIIVVLAGQVPGGWKKGP